MLATLQEMLNAALAAVVMAVLGYVIAAVRAWWTNLLATRISNAAGRAAGQIVEQIAADPAVQAASGAMLGAAVAYVQRSVPAAISSLGVTPSTVEGMVRGELGKLLAPATRPTVP